MKNKQYTYTLPTTLFERVKLLFPKDSLQSTNDRRRALRFFHTLTTKSQYQNGTPDEFVELSSNYLRKMFSGNYSRVINKLRSAELIEGYSTDNSEDSYTTAKITDSNTKLTKTNRSPKSKKFKICQNYSFNFSILNSIKDNNLYSNNSDLNKDFKLLPSFSQSAVTQVVYTYKSKSLSQEDIAFEKEFSDMVAKLEIDYVKLHKTAQDIVEKINVSEYEVGEFEDLDKTTPVTIVAWGTSRAMSIGKAIKLANYRSEKLFKVKNKYYISSTHTFLGRMKASRYSSYTNSISTLKNGDLRARRNDTNNRADTNFTNMKSDFVKIIMQDNNLVQWDMSNSQFTILANYLKNVKDLQGEDFDAFYNLTTTGQLYEYIAEKTGISRSDAKTLMFQILFNKINANIKHKDLIEGLFPTVLNYINSFKRAQGYKKFSVFLQKLESEMFIDNLYPLIKEQTDIVFTKHDAIIARAEDKEVVTYVINKYLESVNFKGIIEMEEN